MQDANSPNSASPGTPSPSKTDDYATWPPGFTPGELRTVEARYKGPDPDLKGKMAIVAIYRDYVKAQFDDHATGRAAGWHTFHLDDFEALEGGDLKAEAEGEDNPDPDPDPVPVQIGAEGQGAGDKVFPVGLSDMKFEKTYPNAKSLDLAADLVHRADETLVKVREGLSQLPDMARRAEEFNRQAREALDEGGRPAFTGHAVPRPLALPNRDAIEALAVSMAGLNRNLNRMLPVLVELRDLGRIFAWGLVAISAVGIAVLAWKALLG